jgi:hypothetical protein
MPETPSGGSPSGPAITKIDLATYHYCVSFIDLLGQRAALKGEGLLPPPSAKEAVQRLHETVRRTVGATYRLQELATTLIQPTLAPNKDAPRRLALPPEQRPFWDKAMETEIMTQRWSDGLVSFVCLGEANSVKCPMNGVHGVILQAGLLCLIGLAIRCPIRGAIELAWGVEARPGELYGAVVARAYELESEVAQYPRVVVGPKALRAIADYAGGTGGDFFAQANRGMAQNCLNVLSEDADGNWIVDYLGDAFRQAIPGSAEFYGDARQFIDDQLAEHRAKEDKKLAGRYESLLKYFTANAVRSVRTTPARDEPR